MQNVNASLTKLIYQSAMSNVGLRSLTSGNPGCSLNQETAGSALSGLFAPLDRLLVDGGDARLALAPNSGLNAYHCQPYPSPETLSSSSSTASSISHRAYEAADHARVALMQSAIAHGMEAAFEARVEAMRSELKAHLGLDRTEAELVFSASGTDSQLQALCLTRVLLGAPLTTIIVAADQTGSGTAHTALGHHFGETTANGSRVRKGEPIGGLGSSVSSIPLTLRDENGDIRPQAENDALVLGAVERAVADGGGVLLQVMDSSKLGWRVPSDQCMQEISARWPDHVQIVVDACQMRLSRRRIAWYLGRRYMVLVTGSKYFTGPPFSGALLVPGPISRAIGAPAGIAPGLCDYGVRSDWPQGWAALRSQFPNRPNLGQWLRWEAALEEIRAYYALPDAFRHAAVEGLGAGIARIMASSPSLRPLMQRAVIDPQLDNDEFALPTIFPFTIECDGHPLPMDGCNVIHRALTRDVSGMVTAVMTGTAADVASRRCLVGQPVGWRERDGRSVAALRICIGARDITESWSAHTDIARQKIDGVLDGVAVVAAKIELLLSMDSRHELLKEMV
jgi:hypothetical protein